MDGLTAWCGCGVKLRFSLPSKSARSRNRLRRTGFLVLASSSRGRDDPKLGHWDRMELKFGRLLGEPPKLTLAKIMGRKSNPDISYLDIEKSFYKNEGRLNGDGVDVPLHGWEDIEPSNTSSNSHSFKKTRTSAKDLNLVRPIMKKGTKSEKPNYEPVTVTETNSNRPPLKVDADDSNFNVRLRKPSIMQSDDIETQKSSKLELKPNIFLKMRKSHNESVNETLAHKDNIRDVTLLKKPEPVRLTLNTNKEKTMSGDRIGLSSGAMLCDRIKLNDEVKTSESLQQNNSLRSSVEGLEGPTNSNGTYFSRLSKPRNELKTGSQQTEQSDADNPGRQLGLTSNSDHYDSNLSIQAALQGKPQRFDPPMKQKVHPSGVLKTDLNNESDDNSSEIKQFQSTIVEGHEDGDWTRAEELLQTGEREEVELISCSSRGFLVSFGSLVGFLPYRDVGAKWKFLAFESWLRKKGLDPTLYKQKLSILGNYEVQNKNLVVDSNQNQDNNWNGGNNLAPDCKVEDLLEEYDQEKTKFLSSFVGQRIKVSVVLADRNSRRLLFSGRPKEKEEMVEKKRSLMSRLSIGDVVKCTIKKITYFGIFVEIEGVPALIHQSEVSWDTTLDPLSYYKIAQTVEAIVNQLDFGLERITLSLKQIRPDPLMKALESLVSSVGDCSCLDGRVETTQADFELADVESLIKELQKIEGVDHVAKGRFFLSPGLAPTFQVYMASVFQNQYKLLARSGNKVQEQVGPTVTLINRSSSTHVRLICRSILKIF